MTLEEFYSTTTPELARAVLGDKAHFHWAVSSNINDPFEQAVIDLFPFIPIGSKVLDCGSGWGGPGRVLQDALKCSVTGVTISKPQADYTQQFFTTHHADLHDYKPKEDYDIALFFESYFHIEDAGKVLGNLPNVGAILIKDFTASIDRHMPAWHGVARTEENFRRQLNTAGFTVEQFIVSEGEFWQPTIDIWFNKLKSMDISQLSPLMRTLLEMCISVRADTRWTDVNSCIIYATKTA